MRKLLFLALSGMLAFTSCKDTTKLDSQDDTGVNFTSSISSHLTKASALGFTSGDEISVYANNAKGEVVASNVKYTYQNEIFMSETPIEYTAQATDYLAIYPYMDELPTSYTIATNQSEGYTSQDIMRSEVSGAKTATVDLPFKHCFSKLEINVIGAGVDVSEAEVTVSARVEVTCDFENNRFEADGQKTVLVPFNAGDNAYEAIVAPQFVSGGSDLISIEVGGETYQWILDEDVTLAQGYKYVCNIRVSDGSVEFSGDIMPWTDKGDIPGGGEFDDDSEGVVSLILAEYSDTYAIVSVDAKDYTGNYFVGSYKTQYLDANFGGDVNTMAAALLGKIDEMYHISTASPDGEFIFSGDLERFNLTDTRAWSFKTETEYIVFVAPVSASGMITDDVVSVRFTTGEIEMSDNVFSADIQDITETTATAYVKTTNDDPYLAACYSTKVLEEYTDEEFMEALIETYGGWAYKSTVSGNVTLKLDPLKPGTEYAVVLFGCEANLPTTALSKFTFTTEGEPPLPDPEIPDVIVIPDGVDFGSIVIDNITSTTFEINITPNDKEMYYLPLLCAMDLYDDYNSPEEVIKTDLMFYKGMSQQYGMTFREVLDIAMTQGDVVDKLKQECAPGTEYVYYAYGVDYNTLQPLTELKLVEFSTLAASGAPMADLAPASVAKPYDVSVKKYVSGKIAADLAARNLVKK